MAKPEWGVKRTCHSCGARFYDLKRTPIVCPKCGSPYRAEPGAKPRRPMVPLAEKAAAVVPAVLEPALVPDAEIDDEALEDEAVEEEEEVVDEELIEDAAEIGEDDDDMSEVMEHVDDDATHRH